MIDATNVTLLPCPFCGGEAMLMAQTFSWEVHCLPCTASVSEETQPEAIAAWNTRTAAEAASKAEMTELVAHTQALIQLAIDGGLTHDLMAQLGYGAKAANGQPADAFAKRARRTVNEARALLAKHQTEGRG